MKNILKSILACVLTALLIAGASWAATLIPVSQGGTGASTASGARSNLGLGTIATQNVGTLTNTKYCTYATGTGFVCNSDGIGSMTYPDAGIALSTGSGWDTSIANNSANWNTAYEWGNHASAGYLTSLSGALLATGATTGATSQAQAFTNGVITGKIYPSADSTTALQFNKADGTTNILNIDTTNGNVGIGTTAPSGRLHLAAGTATASTAPLKFTSGTLLTAPEAGAVEFDGTNLYFTPAAARKIIAFTDSNITGNAGTATALAADPADCAAGTVATAINASGTLTCGITPLISGGTLTSSNVCQYDGTGIDCNLTQDSTGACAAGAVCLGGHTHATTELSGVNAGTDLTADLEEETHAAEHAVGAADTIFPADPDADKCLQWDDNPGTLAWVDCAASGATTALDNLASVAINTSLISDTDSTDDLGSSSKYWANAYIDKIYVNSTAAIDGATAGQLKITGALVPAASDGAALGSTSLMWSDLFLASGAVVNFNNGDITLTHSADTLTIAGGSLVSRITSRVGTTASSATPTPTGDDSDLYTITALAEDAAFAAPSGTPTNGQKLMIRIKDNGTARALSWNAIYRAGDIPLPTTTVKGKTMYLGFVYNSADSKWDLVAFVNNF